MANPSPGFTPKQALPFSSALLDELQGGVSVDIAAQVLHHLPPLHATSHIHDNGCGTGAVTQAIMASKSPALSSKSFQISGTDVMPMFLETYKSHIKSEHWPATAAHMDAKELTFPANTFSHSISNFVFMAVGDDAKAAAEVHRTLDAARQGTAAVTIWEQQPHADAIIAASKATRGRSSAVPPAMRMDWYRGPQVKNALIKGGFKEDSVKTVELKAWYGFKDARKWANIAWSFLGAGEGGWRESDEEKWEEAIDVIVKVMTGRDWYRPRKEGGGEVLMICSAVLAKK